VVIKADFEIQDLDGQTIHYSGTVGTTAINIPTVVAKEISEFWIENPINNTPANETLSFSCDAGVTFTDLLVGESMVWTPKGRIRQLKIKGSTASVNYKMIVNYEDI
jgi:hypothetical protein